MGEKRRIMLRPLNISGGIIATAEAMQRGAENTLYSHFSFARQGGKWQLGQALVCLE